MPRSATAGNANTVARAILEKLPTTDSRVSYSQDRHLFHVVCAAGIVYLCMADEAFGRRIPFAFLEEVRNRFGTAYGGGATTALAYAYNTEFSRVLHQQMDYFSSNPAADALSRAKGEMAEVKSVMVENIDKVLDRGEKIELLVDKTEGLAGDAFRFKKQSSRLKHAMWVKNMKLTGACAKAQAFSLRLSRGADVAMMWRSAAGVRGDAAAVFRGWHDLRLQPQVLPLRHRQHAGQQRALSAAACRGRGRGRARASAPSVVACCRLRALDPPSL